MVKLALRPVGTFQDEVANFRATERQIGALQFKLKLVNYMQAKGYDALVIQDILSVPTEQE